MRAVFVVNPRSAAGRTGARLGELEALARRSADQVEIVQTRSPGDGMRLAAEAAAVADRVIAVGGDGTANEVVNGLMEAGRSGVAFGVLPAGTGSDLVRTLKVPAAWTEAVPMLLGASPRPSDVMEGTFRQADGSDRRRWAINVIGLGMAGDVVRRVNQGSKRLGGTLTFLGATLSAMAAWRTPQAELSWVGEDGVAGSWRGGLINAFVANGQYCGGGMWVGRGGSLDDGLLEILIIPDQSLFSLVARTPKLYDGSIRDVPDVVAIRAHELTAVATSAEVVLADADGEQPGCLPVRIACRARVLPVCMGG